MTGSYPKSKDYLPFSSQSGSTSLAVQLSSLTTRLVSIITPSRLHYLFLLSLLTHLQSQRHSRLRTLEFELSRWIGKSTIRRTLRRLKMTNSIFKLPRTRVMIRKETHTSSTSQLLSQRKAKTHHLRLTQRISHAHPGPPKSSQ